MLQKFIDVQLGSIVRHLLISVATLLISHGIISGDPDSFVNQIAGPVTQIVAGVLLFIATHWQAVIRNNSIAKFKAWLLIAALPAFLCTSCVNTKAANAAWQQSTASFYQLIALKHQAHTESVKAQLMGGAR